MAVLTAALPGGRLPFWSAETCPAGYMHFPVSVSTGRIIKARHTVPGWNSLGIRASCRDASFGERAGCGAVVAVHRMNRPCRTESLAHAKSRHCVQACNDRSRWDKRFLRRSGFVYDGQDMSPLSIARHVGHSKAPTCRSSPSHFDCSSIRSNGISARWRRDSSISTRGWRVSRQSRSFSSVFIFM